MSNIVKTVVQNAMVNKRVREYEKKLAEQSKYSPFYAWAVYDSNSKKEILEKQNKDLMPSVISICMDEVDKSFSLKNYKEAIVVFYNNNGKLDKAAEEVFAYYFLQNGKYNICVADEDCVIKGDDKDENRTNPWSKPCWSEDTLISFNYFGNVFAIRREKFENLQFENIYDFILKATEIGRVGKLDNFLFHKKITGVSDLSGNEKEYNDIKNAHLKRCGFKGEMLFDEKTGYSYPVYECTGNPLVSIIIPSKDNVEVLKTCIKSIREKTIYKNYEIIVVDNGSSEQNRALINELGSEYSFEYFYEAMDFNFSKMCNIGVGKSKGEYILLLNDDMEVIQEDWLSRMLGQAMLPHTGAVGAKLLYPDTTLIQHAGVTNAYEGPTHKLVKMDDNEDYYFGRNKLVYDVLAVTGACLLVSREKWEEVRGLFEGLPVAFNDVDLCFNLYELGYNNVQRNDVVLYHHESLSRGIDLFDKKKIERLLHERDVLYSRHKKLYRYDPYLGRLYCAGTPPIEVGYGLDMIYYDVQKPKKIKPLPSEATMNKMVFPFIEECELAKNQKEFIIRGWAYVPGLDNARFDKSILLVDEIGTVFECPVSGVYRDNLKEGLPDDIHIELSGFCLHIPRGRICPGKYEVWMYAKDSCSRQCMYSKSDKILVVEI